MARKPPDRPPAMPGRLNPQARPPAPTSPIAIASSTRSWRCSPKSGSSRSASPRSRPRAGVSLAELRNLFGSTLAILAAQVKETDRAVLAGSDADMAEEPPRERLFDVLMRRIEVLAPHKAAVRSLRPLGRPQSRSRLRAQRPGGALAAMDADRRRHRCGRPQGHDAGAGACVAVRIGAADLGRRRRSGPCPHHGGARPRARARPALVELPRRREPDPGLRRPPASAPAPT